VSVEDGGSTDYAYDALGRLEELSSDAGTWDYSYVGNSGLLNQITNPNGTKSVYSYDALERLTQVSNQKSSNANLSTFAYGFDDALDPQRDVRTTLDKTIGANPTQRVSYGYDGVDQLTGEVLSQGGSPQWSKSFSYDAMGNRTATSSVTPSDTVSGTYTNNRLNQIVGHSSSWGGGSNTLTSTLQYDQSGNLHRHG
jgi:YD repeat-containing protein